jgi:hypothetical protein
MKGKAVSKDTEPDVVLAPGCYWRLVLQTRLEELLRSKFPGNRRVRLDDNSVVVSVTERSQRDLTKAIWSDQASLGCCGETTARLGPILPEGQETAGEPLVRLCGSWYPAGRQLWEEKWQEGGRHRPLGGCSHNGICNWTRKQEISGQPAVWQKVYTLMRCPGPSCDRGPHCWIDPDGKKHYRMRAPHFRSLIEHVAKGGIVQTHDDTPPEVRHQLYAEDQERQDRKAKETATSPLGIPSINITNVLPGHSQQTSLPGGQQGPGTSVHPSNAASPSNWKLLVFGMMRCGHTPCSSSRRCEILCSTMSSVKHVTRH